VVLAAFIELKFAYFSFRAWPPYGMLLLPKMTSFEAAGITF
jgi:hypothetical protein